MDEILQYLELKNRYFEKFYYLTVQFREATLQHKWDGIDVFLDNRERILNIVRTYDSKIARASEQLQLNDEQVNSYRPKVKAMFEIRNQWISRIVELDMDLISKIDDIKADTIRDLKKRLESAQQVASYAIDPQTHKPKMPKEA